MNNYCHLTLEISSFILIHVLIGICLIIASTAYEASLQAKKVPIPVWNPARGLPAEAREGEPPTKGMHRQGKDGYMKRKNCIKSFIASGACAALVLGGVAPAFAANSATNGNTKSYDVPTSETSIYNEDGARYATATGVHGSAVAGEYAGLSQVINEIYATTGNGIDTTNYKYNPYLGIFGTSANENPDPYVANLMYNWYVEEQGASTTLQKSDNAMVNYLPKISGSALASDSSSYKGTSIAMSFRPDVLGLNYKALTNFDEQIKQINNFSKDSEYYLPESATYVGDENYNPIVASYNESNFIVQTENMYNYASAAAKVEQDAKAAGKKIVTRYGDSMETAQKYELATKGSIFYTLSKINDGTIKKKTIAVVNSIDGTGKDATVTLAANPDPSVSREKTHHIEGLFTTCNNLANVLNPDLAWEGTGANGLDISTKCTVADLAKADVIILQLPDNLSYNFKAANGDGVTWSKNNVDENDGKNASRGDGEGHYKNQFWGPQAPTNTLADNIRAALNDLGSSKAKKLAKTKIFTCVQEGSSSSDGGSIEAYGQYALMNAFVYPEIANQLEQYGYWLDQIAHVKTGKVSYMVQRLCQDLSLAKGVSLSNFEYNADTAKRIEATYKAGMRYYQKNKASIDENYPWLTVTDYFKMSTAAASQKISAANITVKAGKSAKIKVKGAKTTLSFKSNNKKVKVNKSGKVTVAKGTKKKTKATITVSAKASDLYKKSNTIKVKVTVK